MGGIALVQFGGPITTMSQLILDNGLARLAACARRAGHEAVVLDFQTADRVRSPREREARLEEDARHAARAIDETTRARDLGTVGFKLWSGDAYRAAREAVRVLRAARPDLRILGGGPHVDYFGARILRDNPGFDLLVRGEGELPLVMLLDAFASGGDLAPLPNLILPGGGDDAGRPTWVSDDLDAWPDPDYAADVYPAAAEGGKVRLAILETSRGCPYACHFCGHGRKSGRRTRSRAPGRVVDEMESLIRRHGITRFRSGDSNTPPPLAQGIADEILKRGLDVGYTLVGRADAASRHGFDALQRSGCRSVFYGLESGSVDLLERSFNKRLRPEAALDGIRAARRAGLFAITSFIVPAPGETEATLAETLAFIREARPDAVNLCLPIVNPGTAWGERPESFGIEIPEGWFDRSLGVTPSLLYPVDRWEESPVRIGGRSAAEMKRIAAAFEDALSADGILTQVIDDVALMAEAADETPLRFRDLIRDLFDRGDARAVGELVGRINRGVEIGRSAAC